MRYRSTIPEGVARGRVLLCRIQSEGLVDNCFLARCFYGYAGLRSATEVQNERERQKWSALESLRDNAG